MRKNFNQKFWSHGTPLGSSGSVSQKGQGRMFSKLLFPFHLGVNSCPDIVVTLQPTEKLNQLPTRCVKVTTDHLQNKQANFLKLKITTLKQHKRGPLLQTAGHPFPCYLASPVLPSCLLPRQVAHRLSK